MKPVAILILILSFFIAPAPGVVAQSITGQYYGIGNVTKDGNYSQYLTELILVQKGNSVSGEFNYYFKSTHISAKVKGEFNSNTRLLKLQLVPLLNYKAVSSTGADCPMQGYFVLRVAKVETTLSGEFEAIDAYKYTCPSIFIKLKKEVPTVEEKNIMEIARAAEEKTNAFDSLTAAKFTPDTSTAIIEPEEPVKTMASSTGKKTTSKTKTTKNTSAKNTAANIKVAPAKPEATAPTPIDEPLKTAKTDTKNVDTKKIDSAKAIVVAAKPSARTIPPAVKSTLPVVKETQVVKNNAPSNGQTKTTVIKSPPTIPDPIPLKPEDIALTKDLLKRSFEESTVIEVEADSLFIELYDNGEVDGDTVAVFYNRKLLASKQRLGTSPIKLVVPIDTTTQEISMYAENLGIIPPNTAICIIMAGGKRYELTLTSTFIRNGTIRFRKKTQAQIEQEKKYL